MSVYYKIFLFYLFKREGYVAVLGIYVVSFGIPVVTYGLGVKLIDDGICLVIYFQYAVSPNGYLGLWFGYAAGFVVKRLLVKPM